MLNYVNILQFSLVIFFLLIFYVNNYRWICVCLWTFNIFYLRLYSNNYKLWINKIKKKLKTQQPIPNQLENRRLGWVVKIFGLGWVTTNPTNSNFWVGSKNSLNPVQPNPTWTMYTPTILPNRPSGKRRREIDNRTTTVEKVCSLQIIRIVGHLRFKYSTFPRDKTPSKLLRLNKFNLFLILFIIVWTSI